MGNFSVTALRRQWSNPSDVSTILMVIGGDVVQKALAQGTGTWYFTPVCFSFGWVSYAFMALVEIIGHGRLLPEPDYPVKVFNLRSGYVRENKNWVIGRLLRDIETMHSRQQPLTDEGIRVVVLEAKPNRKGPTELPLGWIHFYGFIGILIQLALAAIPLVSSGEWDIMMITAAGTVLVQLAGCLPQWRAEKLPNRQSSDAKFALTQGNGSREIIVIIGNGNCLDLEEIQARTMRGLPLGFWLTRIVVVAQSILWLLLLVNLACSRDSDWVIIAIGAFGMFQNGYLAGMQRPAEQRNLPLRQIEIIRAKKVMDGLMDLEVAYGGAECLRNEFFPGKLRESEKMWWNGQRDTYDTARAEAGWRGTPRSRLKTTVVASGSSTRTPSP
ncbi:hypothetical protein M406DRAFT_249210 [Cryphonectria parasitica EP155]|uniref:Uncharacterized protein n=1 Tax=Cryphonectria parasitica (strain ATCC 38755 / EP155) TaxID=660469 RepID=A0A9P5CTF5_CRYP1|nr:uncharacterized protein M406DRAFT_249210 [Cryphonectria parasitica EP155]KAF3769356.1 hypothetical protein M406DRAFT_249210 [Cryphonectria parasitica EP155]